MARASEQTFRGIALRQFFRHAQQTDHTVDRSTGVRRTGNRILNVGANLANNLVFFLRSDCGQCIR